MIPCECPPTTVDSLLDGAVVLEQPAPGHGYRVNVDAILLARFAAEVTPEAEHLVDLGAGVGAVSLCFGALGRAEQMTLVELDPVACTLAQKNLVRAKLEQRSRVVCCNVEEFSCELHKAPLVVSNPPYTRPGAGRRGPEARRDQARHGDLTPFMRAAAALLAYPGARACFCYPASCLVAFLALAQRFELKATRLAFVHGAEGSVARIALIELMHAEHGDFRGIEPAKLDR